MEPEEVPLSFVESRSTRVVVALTLFITFHPN